MMEERSRRSKLQQLRRIADSPYPALTIRVGRRYLMEYPNDLRAWLIVGEALIALARYEEAEQAVAKALELCPAESMQDVLTQMGFLFLEAGDLDLAVEWFQKAIDADPGDATYRIFLGAVRAKQGRFHDAEEDFRQAIECNDGNIDEAYFNLGLILTARERFEEAAECFREAIRIDPEYAVARRALRDVKLCMKLGRG